MEPHIAKDSFCTYTGQSEQLNATILFISGNPGLIGYYHPFLSLLSQNLGDEARHTDTDDASQGSSFQIYGCSLAGFEVDSNGNKGPGKKLFDVEDQIRFVHEKLESVVAQNAARGAHGKQRVILMGHSVGAYIAMEVLRRHREDVADISSGTYDIIGAVMLFPTVKDIAQSPSGQKLTMLLSIIPNFALVIGFLARLLTLFLPASVLKYVIRSVMRNPPTHALDTTFDFLKKPGGVRQALYMAADEMRVINSDKWTDDVWGVGSAREPITKMFFYFGRNDHWVAEKTRDEIIELRGRKDGLGPKMFVCEEGLPHAFCLKHNDAMAKKVAQMIRDME